MKVLVTGGAGLIGMATRETLQAAGHQVVAIDLTSFGRPDPDLRQIPLDDSDGIDALVCEEKIESIVHCAAISGPMMAKGEPLRLIDTNITGTARLLDIARRRDLKRFVFCSSISVYGDVGPGIITEATPSRPTSLYGATKVACESLVNAFATEYGLKGTSLRIARVYGPYRRANCHLGSIIRDAMDGRVTRIPCDPNFAYHYVHVDDVAQAIRMSLEAVELPDRVYNVGSGEVFTMPEIVGIALDTLPEARIELVPGVDDVPDVQTEFSIERIGKDIGWRPRFELAEGMRAYASAIAAGRAACADGNESDQRKRQ